MPSMPPPGQGGQPPYPAYPGSGYPQPGGGYPPPFPPQQGAPGYPPAHNNFGYPPPGGYPPSTASYPTSQPLSQFHPPYGGYGSNPPCPPAQTSFASTQGSAGERPRPGLDVSGFVYFAYVILPFRTLPREVRSLFWRKASSNCFVLAWPR